jgi:D-alanine-D-alanine ligase
MRRRVALIYNEPQQSRYDTNSERKAVEGVLEAVNAVQQALIELKDEVTLLPLVPPFEEARKKLANLKVDVVFNLFEGFCGDPPSEALIPEALNELGIAYTGCKPEVLRLSLDKAGVKVILKAAGIPTADFQLLNPETLNTFRLGYPCIVKPRNEDASHGISAKSLVQNLSALKRQVKVVSEAYGGSALVEQFMSGREFNASVMGNNKLTVLPVSEIVYTLPPGIPRLLTFAAKWENDSIYYEHTKVHCPAEVTEKERQYIAGTALETFKLMGCGGYARVDMRMDGNGKLNVIELNPNPDISPGTGAARQAEAAGMTYAQFVDVVVNLALEKDKNGRQNTSHVPGGQTGLDANFAQYARI